jgi:hypothetical protein
MPSIGTMKVSIDRSASGVLPNSCFVDRVEAALRSPDQDYLGAFAREHTCSARTKGATTAIDHRVCATHHPCYYLQPHGCR